MRFIDELKRRNVIKVAITYGVVAWLLIQISATLFPTFGAPDWVLKVFTSILIMGFPISLVIAWAFELTPEGLKRSEVNESSSDNRKSLWFAGAAVVVLSAYYSYSQVLDNKSPPGNTQITPDLSVAVLPLINMSENSSNVFFADGLHEEILTNLSYIDNLRVTSRTSTLKYLGADKAMSEIGQELNVKYVVEGSVRRIDDYVRVTVQLIDAETDSHLWASNYDRQLTDVFAIQSAIAKEITNALHLEFDPDSIGRLSDMPTRSVKAYDLYLKAKSIDKSEKESANMMERQIALLEEAVQIDPDFVEAWGFLNEAYDHVIRNIVLGGMYSEQNADAIVAEYSVKSKNSLNRAIALDPNNLETLLAMASDYVAEKEIPTFREERKKTIDRIIRDYPNEAMGWFVLGWWQNVGGDGAAADLSFKKALELDPFNARILGSTLYFYTQIFPHNEMAEDIYAKYEASLGEDGGFGDFAIRMQQFFITADETLFANYRYEYPDTITPNNIWVGTNIAIHNKNLDDFIPIPMSTKISDDLKPYELIFIDDYLRLRIGYHMQRGNLAEAQVDATKLIELHKNNFFADTRDLSISLAYAVLGEHEKASQLLSSATYKHAYYYITLAVIDIDLAVEELLNDPTLANDTNVTDYLAAFYPYHEIIITHPKMVEYYKNKGKWADYLAKRLPEYK